MYRRGKDVSVVNRRETYRLCRYTLNKHVIRRSTRSVANARFDRSGSRFARRYSDNTKTDKLFKVVVRRRRPVSAVVRF